MPTKDPRFAQYANLDTQFLNWKTKKGNMGNCEGNKNMPKKRNTCQEVPLLWRKISSTLLSRPRRHPQAGFMGLCGAPLFPGQEGNLPLPEGHHWLPTLAHLLFHRIESSFLARPVSEHPLQCQGKRARQYGLVVWSISFRGRETGVRILSLPKFGQVT